MKKFVSKILSVITAMIIIPGNISVFSVNAEDTETKLIALTFDDGPNTTTTNDVLDILEEYVYTDSGKDKIKLYKECLSATRKWTLESNGEKSELCRKYQIDESKLIFDENCMDRISNGYDFINVNIRIPSSDKIVNYDKELYINFGEGNA